MVLGEGYSINASGRESTGVLLFGDIARHYAAHRFEMAFNRFLKALPHDPSFALGTCTVGGFLLIPFVLNS